MYVIFFEVPCIPFNFPLTLFVLFQVDLNSRYTGESRAAATSKMEHFVILVNGFQLHPPLR